MAKLTAKRRKALPKSKFAGPGRSYPVDTKNRAKAALSRVSQALNAGRIGKGAAAKIKAGARKVLGNGKK